MEEDILVLEDHAQSEALQKTFTANFETWHKDSKNRDMDTFAAVLEDQQKALKIAQEGGNPRTMRWHSLTIKFALKQAEDNTKAGYQRLRDAFFLPAPRTLRGMQAKMSTGGGYQESVFQGTEMSARTHGLSSKKYPMPDGTVKEFVDVALSVDAAYVTKGLYFNPVLGRVTGFADLSGLTDELKALDGDDPILDDHLAGTFTQMMISSPFQKWQYPIMNFMTTSLSADLIIEQVLHAIKLLAAHGFQVILCICDGASENRKFQQTMLSRVRALSHAE